MVETDWEIIETRLTKAFTPAVPVSENTLFAGRIEQIRLILSAVNQPGQHVVVYGERGVGKTSLANILSSRMGVASGDWPITPRVTCDTTDDFASLWRKLFAQVDLLKKKKTVGFYSNTLFEETKTASEVIPEHVTPDDVRRLLTFMGEERISIIVFDEFDRLRTQRVRAAMADTIKILSDHDVPATVILVGVAESVSQLIAEHRSIERALVQIRMPRMEPAEISDLLERGVGYAGLKISRDAKLLISRLAQGLPHYAHLLGLNAGHVAIDRKRLTIQADDIRPAIESAVANAQASLLEDYRLAVSSPQPDNLYSRVLLACAQAETDKFGYFAAADIRDPLEHIMKKRYQIPSFAKHLKEFCADNRGPVLIRSGQKRRFRYRFANPLMQPLVIMQGVLEGHIKEEQI